MLVALLCYDKPNHVDLRMKLRPTHLQWIEDSGVKLAYAGPMLAEDGQTSQGSIIVGDFPSYEAAEAFSKDDPYAKGGLFDRVEIIRTRKVYQHPI